MATGVARNVEPKRLRVRAMEQEMAKSQLDLRRIQVRAGVGASVRGCVVLGVVVCSCMGAGWGGWKRV